MHVAPSHIVCSKGNYDDLNYVQDGQDPLRTSLEGHHLSELGQLDKKIEQLKGYESPGTLQRSTQKRALEEDLRTENAPRLTPVVERDNSRGAPRGLSA